MNKLYIISLILFMLFSNFTLQGQEKKSRKQREKEHAALVQQWVENQNYQFVAQRAMPMSGQTWEITSSGYELKVSKDTIEARLPYFGVAYVAPMDNTEGGIQFLSKDFKYSITSAKKGGWNISIVPTDTQRWYELLLNVTVNGYGTLTVNDNTRQSISFYGYVKGKKPQE